ncbi:hypothetical protein Gotur_020488 [Gossypium turneri]
MKSLKFDLKKLAVRIHLNHVLLELYIPLYMDRIIVGQQRLSYVKVCVKMVANLVLPRSIDVELRDNFIATTSISFPWIPQRCSECCIFGHEDKGCIKQVEEPVKKWVPNVKIVLEANRFKDHGSLKTKKSSNKGKQILTGSSNRFAILETVNLVEDQIIDRVEIERFEHTEIGKIGHGE